ncbi:MAG: glutaredoxin family protein [Armatimonadota bacterium]|nr:glutaredoxin family protein [Armatimonadota bacterium]
MEFLSQRGIAFTERNLARVPEARRELIQMGLMSRAVIVIGDRKLTGFNPAQLEDALRAAGLL